MKNQDQSPWWNREEFWDAYRPLMFDPDRMADTPADVDRILALTGLKAGNQFLDSCCGFGRHALELARRGVLVTGVDRQESYIREARLSAAREKLPAEFVLDSSLTFEREEAFHGAMNYFTSFGYFDDPEEEETAVGNIFRSLKPGGFFLIDVLGKEILARDFKEREWFERDGYRIFLEYKVLDAFTRIENRWLYTPLNENIPSLEKDPAGGLSQTSGNVTEIVFTHRLYSALELAELLSRCGFESVEIYGNLSGAPYNHKAERLIALARKSSTS